jgi:hypothetical protein
MNSPDPRATELARELGNLCGFPDLQTLRHNFPGADDLDCAVGLLSVVKTALAESKDKYEFAIICFRDEEATNTKMAAACRAILSGWGHQDGVSRAVELAREALEIAEDETQSASPSEPAD